VVNFSLSAQNLFFSYGDRKVLHNVTFKIQKGDFVGILGPNGSGKSTLLHLLSGLLIPDTGTIFISGKNTKELSRKNWSQEIAIVFQETNLNLDLECYDIIMMGRFPHWRRWQKENQQDIDSVLNALQITNTQQFANRPFRELSGGEKQRVMIARALAQKPNILLLDEPTSHLDILHQLDIMRILYRLQKNDITILGVFHDINLVSQFCNQVMFLKKGEIVHRGLVGKSLHAPQVEELFDVEFLEEIHPYSLRPFFMPLGITKKMESPSASIHLICGGGSGSNFMKEFLEASFSVSVGIVNQFDSDQEMASKLGITVIIEKPFSPISDDNFQKAMNLAAQSDYIFIAPGYWGRGNLLNLDLAISLQERGKRIFFLQDSLDQNWDYTEGQAINKLNILVKNHAEVFSTISEVIDRIKKDCLK
jgi:iron complex transport system ATP-binding protein